MQGYEDTSAFIEAFAGNNRYIMDYLIEEVLKIQSDRPGGFAELFSVPLSNIPTNIISMDSDGLRTIGFFYMSSVSSLGEWLDPDNLPVLED